MVVEILLILVVTSCNMARDTVWRLMFLETGITQRSISSSDCSHCFVQHFGLGLFVQDLRTISDILKAQLYYSILQKQK